MEKLSKRLRQVASFVPKGARLLDVGSDHAYLPLYLLEQGTIHYAIAGEVVEGPYRSALSNVQKSSFASQIEVRLADGLAAFEAIDAIDTITICGMGGRLIASILDKGGKKLAKVNRLVLQPNNREDELRGWLSQSGYAILAEEILEEQGKIYEIIVAEKGQQALSDLDLRFGPFLRQAKSPVFLNKWENELKQLEQALAGIPDRHAETRSAIAQNIHAIKEILHES
ncbi:tRNA (adenine(22)-N(1))-methyltransferase [Streptococcus ovuberis]|uniref:tRNA (Adenine-N(1))-methyltransferase n=1 Tax=Streptococcus ovuberis TaxID=1936207 RepID=A0A7X6S188_9STRE|nr:tRNA (adenine(22)-N(1))-methyltransferase TrmK [Streptococcus ovuberis]NKZ20120.1 tRNA (adenine-N(1))-methyltransferase [Streptococcus ovuberis]